MRGRMYVQKRVLDVTEQRWLEEQQDYDWKDIGGNVKYVFLSSGIKQSMSVDTELNE